MRTIVKVQMILEGEIVYDDGPQDGYAGAKTLAEKVAIDRKSFLEGDSALFLDAVEADAVDLLIVSTREIPDVRATSPKKPIPPL